MKNETDFKSGSDSISKTKRSDSDFQRESTSSSYQANSEAVYLRTTISRVQFSSCGCVDVVKSKKCGKLKLPCKADDLIRNIYKVHQNFQHFSLVTIKKKFDHVCSQLNDILINIDGKIK